MAEFWKSAGLHLVDVNEDGWLAVTPDYLRAYFTRPEIHPVEESCSNETALFEALMADPFRAVQPRELDAIADEDTRDNYRLLLAFRDRLARAGTLEKAYLDILSSGQINLPPVFLDQMVHLILRNILRHCADPLRIRAAELFFRSQNVTTQEGRIMLADEEIVQMYAKSGGLGGLGQLLIDNATPVRNVQLDVIDDDNSELYWARSDRFDTVVDFRYTQPALDAFARVIEAWVQHFLRISVRVQPLQSIKDDRWSWHVGLDSEATRLLNALYEGNEVPVEDMGRIVALFRLDFRDSALTIATMRNKPVYLGLAMNDQNVLTMKPQNLLLNLPLREAG